MASPDLQLHRRGISAHRKQREVGRHTSRPDLGAHRESKGKHKPGLLQHSQGHRGHEAVAGTSSTRIPWQQAGSVCEVRGSGSGSLIRSFLLRVRASMYTESPAALSGLQKRVSNFVS